MTIIQCQICDKQFKKLRGLSVHISGKLHNISLQQYYDLFLKKYNEDYCNNSKCNNLTKFIGLKNGYSQYCSYSCSSKCTPRKSLNEKQKKDHSKKIKKIWSEKNSIYRSTKVIKQKQNKMIEHWKNPDNKLNSTERSKKISEKNKKIWLNKEYKQSRSKYMKKERKDPNSIYNDKKYIENQKNSYTQKVCKKISDLVKQAWINSDNKLGDDVWRFKRSQWMKNGGAKYIQLFIDREKQKETQRKRMLDGGAAYCNQFVQNPSKPQVELFNLIQQIFPYPIMNYPYLNKSIDIAIPSLSLAIEYDGSYWHQDKEADNKRQKILEDDGWLFIRYVDRIPSIEELFLDYNNIKRG